MASSQSSAGGANMADEAAFSDRVKRTFGSLFKSLEPPSSSPLSNPVWSLTGAAAERREWRRDKDTSARDAAPCSAAFDDFLSHARKSRSCSRELEDDLEDLDGDGDGDGGKEEEEIDWDVRSCVGLDSTLDNEEEEDAYDKVATGRENAGDRLYMSDIKDDQDSDISSQDDLPGADRNRGRDPRANRWAARMRLREDDEEAAAQADHLKPREAPIPPADKESPMSACGEKLKPILKRKGTESTSKPSKRVRFDLSCIDDAGAGERVTEVSGNMTSVENASQSNGSTLDDSESQVPDHVQNPSKYMRYDLVSDKEIDDKSNTGAHMESLEMVGKVKNTGSGAEEADASFELPKSVTFVPKKKSDTPKMDDPLSETSQERGTDANCSLKQTTLAGVVAEDAQGSEVDDMEADETETAAGLDEGPTFRKQDRQYRSRTIEDA